MASISISDEIANKFKKKCVIMDKQIKEVAESLIKQFLKGDIQYAE